MLSEKILRLLSLNEQEQEQENELGQYGIKELKDGLTIEIIKEQFPWLLEASIKDAVLGINRFGDLMWENGTWENGTWEDGYWIDGTWGGGTWKDGTWENGIWVDGIWKDGYWLKGTWENGIWHGGTWKNGTWENGTWKNGTWENGNWEDGTWEGGDWVKGTIGSKPSTRPPKDKNPLPKLSKDQKEKINPNVHKISNSTLRFIVDRLYQENLVKDENTKILIKDIKKIQNNEFKTMFTRNEGKQLTQKFSYALRV